MSLRENERMLIEAGFTVREGRHKVWRHPRGVVVVTSRTPSDHCALMNDRAVIRRALRQLGLEVPA